MSRTNLFGALAALATAACFALPAKAAQIGGQITADNFYEIFVGSPNYGYTSTGVSDGNGVQWNQMQNVNFRIPDHVLADCDCRIAIAVWGDGSVAEGLFGHLEWNGNQVNTGPAFQVSTSSMNGPIPATEVANHANGVPATPNTYNWPGMPSTATQQWIWDGTGRGGGGDRRARVFSVKCSDVVRQGGGASRATHAAYPPSRAVASPVPTRALNPGIVQPFPTPQGVFQQLLTPQGAIQFQGADPYFTPR